MRKNGIVRIGLISILGIIILIWGLNYLKGKNFLKSQEHYYAVYDKISLLEESAPVTLNGLKIGHVSNIAFLPDQSGRILVEFLLTNENIRINKSSLARIYSLDLMGTKGLEIIRSDHEGFYSAGDTLIGTLEKDLKDQVNTQMAPLKAKAENLMSSIDSLVVAIQIIINEDARINLSKSLESLKTTIQNIEKTSVSIDTFVIHETSRLKNILTNVDSITENFVSYHLETTEILSNLSQLTDTLSQVPIRETVDKFNNSLVEIEHILTEINQGEGTAGKLLHDRELYTALNTSINNLNELIKDIRINPKRYVHFSAFDFGRSLYVSSENELEQKLDEVKTAHPNYRVRILISETKIPLDHQVFKGERDVKEIKLNDSYYYTIGNSRKLQKIIRLKKQLLEKFPDAVIIACSQKEIIDII